MIWDEYHSSAALPVFAVADNGGSTLWLFLQHHAELFVRLPVSKCVVFLCNTLLRCSLERSWDGMVEVKEAETFISCSSQSFERISPIVMGLRKNPLVTAVALSSSRCSSHGIC